MTEAPGKFSADAVKANEAHQTAVGEEKEKSFRLPDKIQYEVPREVAKRLREAIRGTNSPPKPLTVASGSTLADPVLASLIYMDVGRWSGSAPADKDTDAKWGKHRDFGIVHGRLAVLCTYRRESRGSSEVKPIYDDAASATKSGEFKAILPLLTTLSSNPDLGVVQVTKAVLGDTRLATPPKDDRIYVILGDLHAPVMNKWNRSRVDPAPEGSLPDRMGVQSGPGLLKPHLEAEVVRRYSHAFLGWRGRYDPGFWAQNILPKIAPVLGETTKAVVGANSVPAKAAVATAGALAAWAALMNPAAAMASAAAGAKIVGNILEEIRANTVLRGWPDPAQGELTAIDGWFERYHGTSTEKGADIFQDAGTDLERWLDLLKQYRARGVGEPFQLMQLGDLFDFWIGLKCLFDIDRGAEHTGNFPDVPAARAFLKYWLDESLRDKAIRYLWSFDTQAPVGDPGLGTIYLYGNHDTYMGTLLTKRDHGRAPLPGRFDKDPGLVAQHGHQEDMFNTERTAGLGYLLTQAVFSSNYIRAIEDPMGSIGPKFFGGTWTRLGLAETALKACVFANVAKGKKPAMTFVMGHTHEPVLQTINVVKRERAKEPADWHTSVETEAD